MLIRSRSVTNGPLSLGLDATGEFTLYLKRYPGASFDTPDSFSDGEPIATFRRVSVVMGATLNAPARPLHPHQPSALVSLNVFTAALVHSRPFEFQGLRYNLQHLLPHGITQWGDASPTPVPVPQGFEESFAFAGSAIALGK